MEPKIVEIEAKKLVGNRLTMTMIDNKTQALWSQFMPHRNKVENRVNNDFISLQIYGEDYDFDPNTPFEKWAVVEVKNYDLVPSNMEILNLEQGLYAVFLHQGASHDMSTFEYIFTDWLPNNSKYELDNRPHFEILGAKYKNGQVESEEEIYIPIKLLHKK